MDGPVIVHGDSQVNDGDADSAVVGYLQGVTGVADEPADLPSARAVLGSAFGGAVADIDVELDGQAWVAQGVAGVAEGF
jgi:hypothetical protein